MKPAGEAGKPVAPAAEGVGGAGTGAGVTLSAPEASPEPAPRPTHVPPPVVIYQPTPRVSSSPPPRYVYRPRVVAPRPEWGLNVHLQGAFMGSRASNDAHMEGAGVGLRFRPVPMYALEADLDFYGGRDYNDFSRTETAFELNNFIFLNPKSRVQVYLLAGFGWSVAHVQNGGTATLDGDSVSLSDTNYSYFGGQVGAGIEARLSKHIALNADLRGFLRGRIDDDARLHPEFVNADGRTSNTSEGAILTAGITFYF